MLEGIQGNSDDLFSGTTPLKSLRHYPTKKNDISSGGEDFIPTKKRVEPHQSHVRDFHILGHESSVYSNFATLPEDDRANTPARDKFKSIPRRRKPEEIPGQNSDQRDMFQEAGRRRRGPSEERKTSLNPEESTDKKQQIKYYEDFLRDNHTKKLLYAERDAKQQATGLDSRLSGSPVTGLGRSRTSLDSPGGSRNQVIRPTVGLTRSEPLPKILSYKDKLNRENDDEDKKSVLALNKWQIPL